MPGLREADVQVAVIGLLSARGFHVEVRSGEARIYGKGKLAKTKKGKCDLYGWHRRTGQHFELEMKRPGEQPSPEQRVWLMSIERDGIIQGWVDSVSAVDEILKQHGY
jgi:hypothetical protein